MVATAIYSVTMVLLKETTFLLCRAMERRWKRNVVPRVSSVSSNCLSNGLSLHCEVLSRYSSFGIARLFLRITEASWACRCFRRSGVIIIIIKYREYPAVVAAAM